MAAKQATYGDYVITKEDNGKIVVTKGGEVCPNSTRAMREISAQIGYTVDDSWNTQQFGAKLIARLQGENQSPSLVKEVSTTPAEEKKDLPNVKASAADIAGARVRVYGKAQNRTALGIMHAYMVMYPQSKLEDIQKAFPDTLNPDSGVKKNFIYAEEKGTTTDWNGFFKKEEELLTMGDGRKVAVVSMWTKPSFERLVAWAKQYGIIVAEFEAVNKGGEKGGFRLEYLNGYIPPKPRKGIPVWVWILIALLIAALAGVAFMSKHKKAETVVIEKTVVVHDTLYVQQIAQIEENFNAAKFEQGKSELSVEAQFILHDLAKVLAQNPDLKLRVEGHTSAEGDAMVNQKLSEARAQAAITFLIEHEGIDASRLEAVGFGSSKLKDAENPMSEVNRRTEFKIIK